MKITDTWTVMGVELSCLTVRKTFIRDSSPFSQRSARPLWDSAIHATAVCWMLTESCSRPRSGPLHRHQTTDEGSLTIGNSVGKQLHYLRRAYDLSSGAR